MHVFRVGRQLYWRDGEPIPKHVRLKPETEIVDLPDRITLELEADSFLNVPVDAAYLDNLLYSIGPEEDDYGEESFP